MGAVLESLGPGCFGGESAVLLQVINFSTTLHFMIAWSKLFIVEPIVSADHSLAIVQSNRHSSMTSSSGIIAS